VGDLVIVAKVPQHIVDKLKNKNKFMLKGTGSTTFDLGMEFYQDTDGVLCIPLKQYIDCMTAPYQNAFRTKPCQKYSSLLEANDHPKIDDSEFLNVHKMQLHQCLVGALQWAITIWWFDVDMAVMTLSSFCAMPHWGHMECVKQLYGYLAKMSEGIIGVHMGKPDYSALPEKEYDWEQSVYGNISKILPTDAPILLGKPVMLTHY
jgi:hypothetical protein